MRILLRTIAYGVAVLAALGAHDVGQSVIVQNGRVIAIEAAEGGDYSEVELLLTILSNPYVVHPEAKKYQGLPPDWASTISVSCSS